MDLKRVNLSLGFLICTLTGLRAHSQQTSLVLARDNSTIALEPYAPNIVRVTLSLAKDQATAPPGFGFVARSSSEGWSHQQTDAADVYRSSRMIVTVDVNRPGHPSLTERDIGKFFNGSAPPSVRTSPAAPMRGRTCSATFRSSLASFSSPSSRISEKGGRRSMPRGTPIFAG